MHYYSSNGRHQPESNWPSSTYPADLFFPLKWLISRVRIRRVYLCWDRTDDPPLAWWMFWSVYNHGSGFWNFVKMGHFSGVVNPRSLVKLGDILVRRNSQLSTLRKHDVLYYLRPYGNHVFIKQQLMFTFFRVRDGSLTVLVFHQYLQIDIIRKLSCALVSKGLSSIYSKRFQDAIMSLIWFHSSCTGRANRYSIGDRSYRLLLHSVWSLTRFQCFKLALSRREETFAPYFHHALWGWVVIIPCKTLFHRINQIFDEEYHATCDHDGLTSERYTLHIPCEVCYR